jgi:hypothetical protein
MPGLTSVWRSNLMEIGAKMASGKWLGYLGI